MDLPTPSFELPFPTHDEPIAPALTPNSNGVIHPATSLPTENVTSEGQLNFVLVVAGSSAIFAGIVGVCLVGMCHTGRFRFWKGKRPPPPPEPTVKTEGMLWADVWAEYQAQCNGGVAPVVETDTQDDKGKKKGFWGLFGKRKQACVENGEGNSAGTGGRK